MADWYERIKRGAQALASSHPVTLTGIAAYGAAKSPEVRNWLLNAAQQTAQFMVPAGIESSLGKAAASTVTPWYSALRKYAEEKLPNLFEGQQAKNTLRKVASADEWAKSGLEEKLQPGQKYTKQDVLSHIEQNTPELKDVVLGEPPPFANLRAEYDPNTGKYYAIAWKDTHVGEGRTADAALTAGEREIRQFWVDKQPKFSTYQEPGGTNYKEMFVTAPSSPNPRWTNQNYNALFDFERRTGQQAQTADYRLTNEFKQSPEGRAYLGDKWQDGHSDYSDIENPIVRLRFNDRIDAEGKKVLFLEEMQPPSKENQAKMPPELLKRWREIGMKRAVKYAADHGYDKVAWTTGKMQAGRYDLSKQVSRLQWLESPLSPESGRLTAFDANGNRVINKVMYRYDISDYVGKEVGKSLLDSNPISDTGVKGGVLRELAGQDLKVGGEGLKRVYDQDLPNVAKKLGAKVGTTEINTSSGIKDFEGNEFVRSTHSWEPPKSSTVPSIDIAPLAEKAKSGFPIYDIAPIAAPLWLFNRLMAGHKSLENKR